MFEKALKITPFINQSHNLKPRRSLLCLFQISFVLKISLNQPHISCFYCFLLKKFIPNLILIMYWNSISTSGFVNLFFGFRPVDGASEETNPVPDSLWRRYSEFELLRNYLLVTYPFWWFRHCLRNGYANKMPWLLLLVNVICIHAL